MPAGARRNSAAAISAEGAALQFLKGHEASVRIRGELVELVKATRAQALKWLGEEGSTMGSPSDTICAVFDSLSRDVANQLEALVDAQTDFTRRQLDEQKRVMELKIETCRKAADVSKKEVQLVCEEKAARQLDQKLQAFAAESGQDSLVETMARIAELGEKLDEANSKLANTEEELEKSRAREATVDALEKELREVKMQIGEIKAEANQAKAARDASEARATAAEEAAAGAMAAVAAAEAESESKSFAVQAVLSFMTIVREKRRKLQTRLDEAERSIGVLIAEREGLAADLEASREVEIGLRKELAEAAAAREALEARLEGSEAARLEAEAAAASSQIRIGELEEALAGAEARNAELGMQLEESRKELADEKASRAAEQQAAAAAQQALTEKAEAAEAMASEAKAMTAAAEARAEAAEAAAAGARAEVEAAKQEIARIQAVLEETSEKLRESEAFAAKAREQVEPTRTLADLGHQGDQHERVEWRFYFLPRVPTRGSRGRSRPR